MLRSNINDLENFEQHMQAFEQFQMQIYAGMDMQVLLIYLVLFLMVHFFVGLAFPFGGLRQPIFWSFFGNVATSMTKRLNRQKREASTLVSRGLIFGAIMMLLAYIMGDFFRQITEMQHPLMQKYAWIAVIGLWMGTINFVLPLLLLKKNMKDLEEGREVKAKARLQPFCSADLSDADAHKIARYTAEASIALFTQMFIGPLFWFVLAGGYGLFCYVVLAAAYRQLNFLGVAQTGYASAITRLYRFFDYLPQKLSYIFAFMALMAAPMAKPMVAWKNRKSHDGADAFGRLYHLIAYGFSSVLGGRYRHVTGVAVERPWYGAGDASAKMPAKDLNKIMILLLLMVSFVAVMLSFLIFYMK